MCHLLLDIDFIIENISNSLNSSDVVYIKKEYDNIYICINHISILRVILNLGDLKFNSLVDMFAVRYEHESEIYYQLKNNDINRSIFLVSKIINGTSIQSVTLLYDNACWYEREIFEKQNITFKNNGNLSNIFVNV